MKNLKRILNDFKSKLKSSLFKKQTEELSPEDKLYVCILDRIESDLFDLTKSIYELDEPVYFDKSEILLLLNRMFRRVRRLKEKEHFWIASYLTREDKEILYPTDEEKRLLKVEIDKLSRDFKQIMFKVLNLE